MKRRALVKPTMNAGRVAWLMALGLILLLPGGLAAAEAKKGAATPGAGKKATPVPKAAPVKKSAKATPVPKAEKAEPAEAPKKSDKLSKDGQAALQVLLSVRSFQDVEVRGGEMSAGVKAFRVLVRDPAGDGAFKKLLEDGTKAGQLYGLCGVYFTDPASFRGAAERLHDGPSETVPYEVGDTTADELVSTLILSKEPDAVRLKGPKDSVREWLRRTGKKSYRADIFGGAIPMAFHGEAGK